MDYAIVVAIAVFMLYLLLDYLSTAYLGNDALPVFFSLVYFMFNYATIDPYVGPFYSIMSLIVLIFIIPKFIIQTQNAQSMKIGGQKFKGPAYYLLNVAIGFATFMLMRSLLATDDVNKLQAYFGVPLLSIAAISSSLSITTVMILGTIENKFIIIVYEMLNLTRKILAQAMTGLFTSLLIFVPVLGGLLTAWTAGLSALFVVVGPLILASAIFAILHIVAFNLVFGALFFAFITMFVWLVLYIVTGNDISMNVGHMAWNGYIQFLRRSGGGL